MTADGAPSAVAREWSAEPVDVLLADGTVAVIRSLVEEDRAAVLGLHESVSVDTLRLRFFSPSRETGRRYVDHLFSPDNTSSAALVALVRGRIAGLATAEVLSPDSAEVAFLVADEDRGRGLGSLLLEHLAALGRRYGVSRFEAEVLGDNYGMLHVFRAAGFATTRTTVAGEVEVALRTDASREAVEAADRREWRAAARSLRPLLHPTSVAVVGVRRSAGGFGHGVLDAIRSSSYAGTLYVIHPEAESIDGLPTSRSLGDLDEPVDLVVVAVPADGVADVLRDAAANRAGAAIVISSGFSGTGSDERRRELLAIARAHSLRLVGPNSQGVLDNGEGLNATLLHDVPEVGGLAVASQSGGMGFALLDLARDVGLGVQSFVSLGDKVDVSSNDLLAAWMDDDGVAAGALYLESFGNALKFARTARRFAEQKPLLAVVGGRSRARQDTTAASTIGVGVDALLDQSGVIACRTGAELTETALLLVEQPLPGGFRVCIVSNTGGVGALTTDRADLQGMVVSTTSGELGAALRAAVPGAVDVRNPIDLGADVTPAELTVALRDVLEAGEADAVLVLLVANRLTDRDALFSAVARARSSGAGVPLLLVTPGAAFDAARRLPGVTGYRTTDAAIGALGRAMRYAAWRRVPAEQPEVELGTRGVHARTWVRSRLAARSGQPEWLAPSAQSELLAPYGIHLVGRLAAGPDEAEAVATEIGYPVAVKVADPTVLHKSDRGLVRVDVRTGSDVADAVRRFADELGHDRVDVLVQPVVPGHVVSVGLVHDPQLGPLVRVGGGAAGPSGSWAEEVLLLPPVEATDAARAVRALRIWPQMVGDHGLAEVDIAPLEALVKSVGQLAADVPHVAALTLEPVVVNAHGLFCVDVKVRIAEPPELDTGVPRRLRS
ncbi:GNAT family N-acetyltransferase [Nocardioides zhouii]|uniref:GNAT family N-acetyltransferase n=1 Tax=Nocardioides zhouii TaxID=1168729 RepID=A0A4Q2T6Z5_9ACTN|nr:GNAT family N-acetyltransferase [Nocardioides zhouii]RYC13861.1 GNAT family N-acetyltransferase [Nocardioides zhouii]